MRHYEIILLVKPDTTQVSDMMGRYTQFILESTPKAEQVENQVEIGYIGRESIYPIKKYKKAYFVRMNIRCLPATQEELIQKFLLNDEIMRHHNLKRPVGIKKPILLHQAKETESHRQNVSAGVDVAPRERATASFSKETSTS